MNKVFHRPSGPAPDSAAALRPPGQSGPLAGSSARPSAGGTAGCGSSCWSGPVPCAAPAAGTPPPPGSCRASPPSPPAARPLHPVDDEKERGKQEFNVSSTR